MKELKIIGYHPNGFPITETPYNGYNKIYPYTNTETFNDISIISKDPEIQAYWEEREYSRNVFAGYNVLARCVMKKQGLTL